MKDWIVRHRRRAASAVLVAAALACGVALAVARADETPAAKPPAASPAPPAPAQATQAPATQAQATHAPAGDTIVAQRGDIRITAAQVRDMIRYADPEQRHLLETNPQALLTAVRDRLLKLVLLHEAEAVGWQKHDDVAYRAELAREDAIAASWIAAQVAPAPDFPSEDQIKAAYEANKSKLMVPRQYHIAQIYLAVPQGASKQADEDAQHRIADLRQQIVKQHGDFAVLAKRFSDEKATAVNGGELGWVREDALVPQIRAAVQALSEGGVSEPIRSPTGWHLIKLLGVKQPTQATLAESREALVNALRQERLLQGQRSYLGTLLQVQQMQVNEVELSKFAVK